eukprot:2003614-Prymnesium_polylepis.1
MSRAGFPSGRDVVHFKGFAGYIIMNEEYEELVRLLIDELRRRAFKALIWDGDDYGERSFTGVLPLIKRELPHLRLGAVLLEKDRHERGGNPQGFHGSWSGREDIGAFDCFLVDSRVKDGGFAALGWLALRATCSPTTILLGGGPVYGGRTESSAEHSALLSVLP